MQDYEAAAHLNDSDMIQAQMKVVQILKAIGNSDAIAQIGQLMMSNHSNEYMHFALPDALAELLQKPQLQSSAIDILVQGVLHGKSETLQTACIRKLLQVEYTPLYSILVSYHDFLILDKTRRPSYWRTLISIVNDAITSLHPYIEPSLRINIRQLQVNQPIQRS